MFSGIRKIFVSRTCSIFFSRKKHVDSVGMLLTGIPVPKPLPRWHPGFGVSHGLIQVAAVGRQRVDWCRFAGHGGRVWMAVVGEIGKDLNMEPEKSKEPLEISGIGTTTSSSSWSSWSSWSSSWSSWSSSSSSSFPRLRRRRRSCVGGFKKLSGLRRPNILFPYPLNIVLVKALFSHEIIG